jgi:hypothetical protein
VKAVSSRPEPADSSTYGHEILEEAPVTSTTTYTATSDGSIKEHSEEATPDPDQATYRCTCGDSFDTRDEAIDHIETKAEGITTDHLNEISTEAKGTTYYGFECLGLTAHTNCIMWRHETLDIIVYATPGFRDSNAIDIGVRARCGAEEVINDHVPVDDVTELTPDQYTTIVDQWLLENLVNTSVGDTDEQQ